MGVDFLPCGWTAGRTGMTKVMVTFRNFANAPKKQVPRTIFGLRGSNRKMERGAR